MTGGRGFWPVVALVLVGHGAVLTQWRPAPRSVENPREIPPASLAFHVRPVLPAPLGELAPQEPPAVPLAGAPTQDVEAAATPATAPPFDPPYLPRAELTVAPTLLQSVDVLFPEDVEGIVNLRVQATLFIDEDGVVRRVRLESPDVHASFARAILDAFNSARFTPGKVDALPVRSQLRVEVEFQAPGARR